MEEQSPPITRARLKKRFGCCILIYFLKSNDDHPLKVNEAVFIEQPEHKTDNPELKEVNSQNFAKNCTAVGNELGLDIFAINALVRALKQFGRTKKIIGFSFEIVSEKHLGGERLSMISRVRPRTINALQYSFQDCGMVRSFLNVSRG